MRQAASTPEELDSLFEDAFVIGDFVALGELFEPAGVLLTSDGSAEARTREPIAQLAAQLHARGYSYLAEPRRVIQARRTALVIGAQAVNVMRRGKDASWRYAISLPDTDTTIQKT